MHSYRQFCPTAVGAEIFAERWTPLIVRDLFAGSTRFNQLQRGLPRIPNAILAHRLQNCAVRFRDGWRWGSSPGDGQCRTARTETRCASR